VHPVNTYPHKFLVTINTISLIDTGSSVSTVSHSFYIDNFSDLPIHPIKELLRIECADGQELPYEGFIEVVLVLSNR
jgi:hypothetical protein